MFARQPTCSAIVICIFAVRYLKHRNRCFVWCVLLTEQESTGTNDPFSRHQDLTDDDDDEEDKNVNGDATLSPDPTPGTAADTTAVRTAANGTALSSAPQVEESSHDPAAVAANGPVAGASAVDSREEAMDVDMDVDHDQLVNDRFAAVGPAQEDSGADRGGQAAAASTTAIVATAPQGGARLTDSWEDMESIGHVDPRAGMKEIAAMVGEIGYDVKQDVMRFLANPEAGPVNPSLPVLTAEQEARLRNPSRSVRDWDAELILFANPFVQLAREHLRPRITAAEPPPAAWGPERNSGERPSVLDVVPSMRRGIRSPEGRRAARERLLPPRGLSGSAFGTTRDRHAEDSARASCSSSAWTLQTGSGGGGVASPHEKRHEKRRMSGGDSAGYDEIDGINRKRHRLDEEGSVGQLRTPGFGSPPSTPVPRRQASAAYSLATTPVPTAAIPARTPRHGGGALIGDLSRGRSSGSVLRRRNPFTPRTRSRLSLVGERARPDAGTLGEWLDSTGGAGSSESGVGRSATGSSISGFKGSDNCVFDAVNGRRIGESGGNDTDTALNARATISDAALDGADTRLRRVSTREAAAVASRAAAKARAAAEVGSILMAIVGQQQQQQQQYQHQQQWQSPPSSSGPAAQQQPASGANDKVNIWKTCDLSRCDCASRERIRR